MPRRTIRLTSATDERIESAAKVGGYSSASAFLRAAINKELAQGREGLGRAEEQIVASIMEVRQDVRRLERAQQALFALVDSLAKVLLTCVPEPRGAAMEPALAEARNRHARLLNNAGHAMLSDSLVAMEELISRGEK
jgi:Arc/MetJ-type ribon-helix-helix transcriptional regulator